MADIYTVETVDIETVTPDAANLRDHENNHSIPALMASLSRFGQKKPIVLDRDGVCRAGNGTLEAAKRLGWKSIAVHKTNLSGAEAIAYAIADNRSAELSDWHKDDLLNTVTALAAEDEMFKNDDFRTSDLFADMHDLKFDAQGVDAVVNAAKERADAAGEAVSHVRMVQLFFSPADFAKYEKLIKALAEKLNIDNPSDTVLKAIVAAALLEGIDVDDSVTA